MLRKQAEYLRQLNLLDNDLMLKITFQEYQFKLFLLKQLLNTDQKNDSYIKSLEMYYEFVKD